MAAKLVILRHGEKPKGKKSALELSRVGKARAKALAQNILGKGAKHPLFGREGPDAFLAITPHTLETASPSAESWSLPVSAYSISGHATPAALAERTQEAAKRVKRALARGRTVVMVWEHKHIANARLAPETTLRFLLNLDRLKDVPDNWSDDDYDSLWIIACGRNGKPKHFELRPQHFRPAKAKP